MTSISIDRLLSQQGQWRECPFRRFVFYPSSLCEAATSCNIIIQRNKYADNVLVTELHISKVPDFDYKRISSRAAQRQSLWHYFGRLDKNRDRANPPRVNVCFGAEGANDDEVESLF